jgi:hypothetical protein
MNNTVTFQEKSVYGRILIYPKCDKANLFAGLIGVKTFTTNHLQIIQALGYKVELISIPK